MIVNDILEILFVNKSALNNLNNLMTLYPSTGFVNKEKEQIKYRNTIFVHNLTWFDRHEISIELNTSTLRRIKTSKPKSLS